ncbi:DUF5677 domain-containing protein [Pseudoalteromonas shioyasakiensis]|uniref:DUF5677 domain-containing protein n=1 Tax=Pseudoalteromonas shioyasakiensis TaxID=1190813 RepID=UPI0022B15221|nr:DUF5677 domain-containing protein [Pseudoalteromonas shioyasakiensis]MCZ4251278.1 hypothetical protein [Pseudoalteromonas shioyasakiensis]
MELELNSNPLSLIRSLPTRKVPIEKIKGRENFEPDDIFTEKYTKFMQGKLKAYATRVSLKFIKPGFYRPTKEGLKYICDEKIKDEIEHLKKLIKMGVRPSLFLYQNINKNDSKRFLCPDDINTYRAYKELNIAKPPVIILGSKSGLEESCYVIKAMKCTYNERTEHLDGFFCVNEKAQPSLLGYEKPPFNESFDKLIEVVELTKQHLKDFHKGGNVELHYHHTLYSILQRAEESLISMQTLFNKKLYVNAGLIVRSLYELSLTFYIDWLGPDQIYKYLQLSSVMKLKEWEKLCDKTLKKQVKEGLSRSDAQTLKDAKMRGFHLASKVADKAKLFPFGEEHHQDIYSFLSKITHHDFSMTARYTSTLEHGDESVFHEDIVNTSLYCADFFIAAIITRVLDDVGQTIQEQPE